ncbi:glycosyltransferase involved in cell wall biosynthesis [Pontibacter aydingkolensis]|uniref:Glycosyltransferase family 4 protein n=1 Tax=Pontibacter aydingkolensis TaxID=1911536 RepID=A0ABS7CYY9_9BACT|nr:glycosyltransferase family 4 protein [Pontibacter aydingkolensis]MBW7469033.1 glycosyltransferase family 4 protein [Pontibacter aydingkolensis]
MKIAYILPSLANKGPILVAKDLVTFLKDKADITVFYFDSIEEVDFECPTIKISLFNSVNFSEFDIVHSHMLRPDAFLYLNRKKITGKCVSTLHSYVEMDLKNTHNSIVSYLFTKIWSHLLSKHDKLVALSLHMQEYYRNLYSNKKLTYIYNGRELDTKAISTIPDEDLKRINLFKGDSMLLGVSALLTERKGIDQSIRLLARMPNLKLLIVGDGPAKRQLLKLAHELKVTTRCLFLGYRKEGHRYYSLFDIYTMTSRSEGFPLALIEAAAYGIPTLASDLPVFQETFSTSEVSFYKLDDIDSMQKAIEYLITNRKSFSENILCKYKLNYTAQEMASNYYNLYKQLV